MDEDNLQFSWNTLFFVTAISCMLFSFAVKLLEGVHSQLILLIGAVAFCLAIINLIIKNAKQQFRKNKSKKINVSLKQT